MNITCRGEYATMAMLELARSTTAAPVSLGRIAARNEISPKYLQQIMAILWRAGLVRVVKGARGGFLLARPPDETRIGDILRAVEGDFSLLECVRREDACTRAQTCLARPLWAHASTAIAAYFDAVTLADVLSRNMATVKFVAPA